MDTGRRYGPAGFIAMLANIVLLGGVTAIFSGAYIVFIGAPILAFDAGIAFVLSRFRGRVGQFGWGLLLGCLTVLGATVWTVLVFIIAKATG